MKATRLIVPAAWAAAALCSMPLAASAADASNTAMSRSEARQMVPDSTPQQRYNTSRKEAQAAYQEALAACRSMSAGERTSCMKEAKQNLQSDLAYAKDAMKNPDTASGSSGTAGGIRSSVTPMSGGTSSDSAASPPSGSGMRPSGGSSMGTTTPGSMGGGTR
ncbi:hypothetical protein SAMN06265795_102394 [Noviherbaspirillum humi]|uniref:DUF4398 domain-containing protein n=2 Tax=Noviherbaspirillum humi TaxID=1688639 RepID=A0A239DW48_9BURK|nr:hypothetical protein SAMN06265795_102394 [Noviherbaspirillum humi]